MPHSTSSCMLSVIAAMLPCFTACNSEQTSAPSQSMGYNRHVAFSSSKSEWGPTGSLATARLLHTTTLLRDGRVLAAGGYNRLTEIYDPGTGTWARTADTLNTHRAATATLLINGKVLITSVGSAEWNSGISAELYDPDSSRWTATSNMTTPRLYHTATLLQDGRVLVAGGADAEYGGLALSSVEIYDPGMGTWILTAPMASPRRNHTATLLANGMVLVAGGTGANGTSLQTAEVFDPATGSWSSVGEMVVARAHHSAAALPDGRALVTGGGGLDWDDSASTEIFDPTTSTWAAASSMASPRRHHLTTALPDGKVLVTGGFHEYTGILSAAEVYNPATDVWLSAGSMSAGRYLHTATLLKTGLVLVAGGFSNGNQASSELHTPSSAKEVRLTVDVGSNSVELFHDGQKSVTTVFNLSNRTGETLQVTNEAIIVPDNGGLSLTSDYPADGYHADRSISFIMNQSLQGLAPGVYQVTNRAIVNGVSNEETSSFTVRVLPSGGEPLILPLGAWPDAVQMNTSTEITFTAAIARFLTPPDHLLLRRVDGSSAQVVAVMRDDGTGGDLMAGDGVYSAKHIVHPGEASLFRYKATSTFPGVSDEKSSAMLDLSLSCHPIVLQPYQQDQVVIDPTNGTTLLCNEVLVSFVEGIACSDTTEILRQLIGPGAEIIGSQPGLGFYQVRVPGSCAANTAYEAVAALSQDPRILRAMVNFVGRADEVIPNDSLYGEQYGLAKIRADEAWVMARGASIVAVVDTGIDYNHPDLSSQVLNGQDFVNNDTDSLDDLGHGTKVASIIAAKGNNSEGIAGVAWGSKLLAVKAISWEGSISTGGAAAAIKYAADIGAKIINCSWGFWEGLRVPIDTSVLRDAINYATTKGSIVVAASGNAGTSRLRYPCAYPDVLCVAATDSNDYRPSFSNYGEHVNISAPGVDIIAALMGGGYGTNSGTSFSAPWVSGSASMVWSHQPSWTAAQVRQRLLNTASPLGGLGLGSGRVDLFEAVFNGSFEDGIRGWSAQGTAGSLGSLGLLLPKNRSRMSFLSSGPDAVQIQTTLEQSFTIQSGVVTIPLKFDYNFITEEYPEWVGRGYNDNVRIVLTAPDGTEMLLAYEEVDSSAFVLVDGIDFPGGDRTVGSTGWKTISAQVPVSDGPGKYGIRIRDEGDGIYDSNLLIDNIRFK